MKDCPSCKQQIQADAKFCAYCGARFTITYQGYCANCHTIRGLDASNRCVTCGGEVVDRQPYSQFQAGTAVQGSGTTPGRGELAVNEIPPGGQPRPQTNQPDRAPRPSRWLRVVRGCLVSISLVMAVLLAFYYLSSDFRRALSSLSTDDPAAPAVSELADDPLDSAMTEEADKPTNTPRPTATARVDLPAIPPNALCAGAYNDGISCLDDGAWLSMSRETLPYTGHVSDLANCPDAVYLLASDVLYGFTDGKWTQYGQYGGSTTGEIGCGKHGDVWIFDSEAAFHLEGSAWTQFVYETVLEGVGYLTVNDVVVTADEQVWVAANENVVHLDGTTWTVFENTEHLHTEYRLTGLAVSQDGTPWVSFLDGLATFDGQSWTKIAPPASSNVNTVYIDPQDQVWVGTDGGVSMITTGGGWQRYPIGSQAGRVISLAMDGQQRLWVGTDWGLGILEGGNYTFYHMANTDLLMNYIQKLIVLGDGPSLPEKFEKAAGSITGQLVDGAAALGSARVEICVQSISLFYSSATPCSEQPYKAVTTTSAEGDFAIDNVPPGQYIVTFQMPDGSWKVRSDSIGVGSAYILVRPGETTSLGKLDVAE